MNIFLYRNHSVKSRSQTIIFPVYLCQQKKICGIRKNLKVYMTVTRRADCPLPGCCKAAGVNFRDRLLHILTHIHDYDNDYSKDLPELLPHNRNQRTPQNFMLTPNVFNFFEIKSSKTLLI
jgi:hypothetical protein